MKGGVVMVPSPKVKRHLSEIKREQWTGEELRELLRAIAQDYHIQIKMADEADNDDFWELSPEEEQKFNELLDRSTKDLKNKRYTEYNNPRV
jgi:hypothetical protein